MSFKTIALKDSPGWLFDHVETSGTTMVDQSTNGNNGVYIGSPTLNQRSLTFLPHEGRSILFSGTKRATVPAGIVTTDTYTYEFLIRPETVSGVQCLAHDGTNGIYINSGKLSFFYSASYHDADTALVAGQKYLLHVAVTAGAVEFFLDRVSDGTAASAPIFSATSLFAENGGGNELNVSACISACYPALALPSAKIRERYREAFSVGFRKVIANQSPILHVPMAETVGETTGFDVSGNDLDGTYSSVTLDQTNMLHQMHGGSVLFDGASGHLLISDNVAIQNIFDGGGVAGILLNATSDGEGDAGRLMDKNGWHIAVIGESGGSAKIQFTQLFSTTNGVWEATATDLTLAADDCVIVDYDNTLTTNDPVIYIAGQAIALTETSTPVGTRTTDVGSDLYIGNNAAGSATFHGRLSNAFLAPAFTANEPLQINESFKSRYAAEVISYNPTSYKRMTDASGAIVDYGSGGNDGTVVGGVTYSDADSPLSNEAGHTSLLFNGSTGYIQDGASRIQTADNTVIAWAKGGSLTTNVIYNTRSGADNYISSLRSDAANNYAQFTFRDTSATLSSVTSADDITSAWGFLAGTADTVADELKLYINANKVAEDTASIFVSTDSDALSASIGSNDGSAFFSGRISENAVWDGSVLTEPSILDIYEMASYDLLATTFGITGLIAESLSATEFFVRASQLDDGAFIADTVMQGDQTYTFDFSQIAGYETYADEVLLTVLPKTGKRRLNSTPYTVGDYYIAADVETNDHIYRIDAITTGVTETAEPTLNQVGGTTVDGGVTVQDMGVCPTPKTQITYAAEF